MLNLHSEGLTRTQQFTIEEVKRILAEGCLEDASSLVSTSCESLMEKMSNDSLVALQWLLRPCGFEALKVRGEPANRKIPGDAHWCTFLRWCDDNFTVIVPDEALMEVVSTADSWVSSS
jgi:hypothetical protein